MLKISKKNKSSAAESNNIIKAREGIVAMGIKMIDKKMMAGSWGNISVRIDKDLYAITPSGHNYESLTVDDIVIVNKDGDKVSGNLIPSTETALHIAIYKEYPQAKAVIHTHSIYASALAAMRKDLPPIIEDAVEIVGSTVRCAKYALPGTKELSKNAVEALGENRAALMANHGAVCWGEDLYEAFMIAEIVEKAAQIFCIASSMGGVVQLNEEQIAVMHKFYLEHYSKRQKGEE